MDDELPKIAESERFWRLNTLAAHKGINLDESTAENPEDLEFMKNTKAEIQQLTDKENAVKARHKRIFSDKSSEERGR